MYWSPLKFVFKIRFDIGIRFRESHKRQREFFNDRDFRVSQAHHFRLENYMALVLMSISVESQKLMSSRHSQMCGVLYEDHFHIIGGNTEKGPTGDHLVSSMERSCS